MQAVLGVVVNVSAPVVVSNVTRTTVTEVASTQRTDCHLGFWCAAGIVTPCPLGTYNPTTRGSDGLACLSCPPNSHTEGIASVYESQCVCNNGFVRVVQEMGGVNVTSCYCPAGYARDEVRGVWVCMRCAPGQYKGEVGNRLCTKCAFEHASTLRYGSTSESECVCAAGYFDVGELTNGSTRACRRCDERTSCEAAGMTTETLALRPGYWRVSPQNPSL